MNYKYGIGFFTSALIVMLLISGAYQFSYHRAKERAQVNVAEKTEQQEASQPSVTADGSALKEDCYYLMEVNGYVVVYLSDKKTAYEYTDILYEELPDTLKQEIKNGKYIENTEELYGFLENYSS